MSTSSIILSWNGCNCSATGTLKETGYKSIEANHARRNIVIWKSATTKSLLQFAKFLFFFGGESLQDGDCKTGHLMASVRRINRKTVSNSGFKVLDSGFFVSGTWIPDSIIWGIPDSLSCIPEFKAQDSWFCKHQRAKMSRSLESRFPYTTHLGRLAGSR